MIIIRQLVVSTTFNSLISVDSEICIFLQLYQLVDSGGHDDDEEEDDV